MPLSFCPLSRLASRKICPRQFIERDTERFNHLFCLALVGIFFMSHQTALLCMQIVQIKSSETGKQTKVHQCTISRGSQYDSRVFWGFALLARCLPSRQCCGCCGAIRLSGCPRIFWSWQAGEPIVKLQLPCQRKMTPKKAKKREIRDGTNSLRPISRVHGV